MRTKYAVAALYWSLLRVPASVVTAVCQYDASQWREQKCSGPFKNPHPLKYPKKRKKNSVQMNNLVSFRGLVRASRRFPLRSSQQRGLHAAWSVLLSYEWLSYSGLADRVIIGDEPESVTGLLKKKQRCSFTLTN